MKKYHIILLFVISALFASNANAIVVQKIHLKNGSVLYGFIERQDVNGLLNISTDNAIICAKSDSVTITREQMYSESELEEAWIEWATENDAFQIQNDVKKLALCDISIREEKNERHYTRVRIIEKGAITKFLEITPNKHICKWSDVDKVCADKRSKTELSGVNRTYQLKNGSAYSGEYAEETDSTLSLYLNDGSVMTFKTNDVIKYTFSPINPNQSLFEQTSLVDVVESNSTIEGVIVEQSYTSHNDSVNYIIVQQENGTRQEIKIADINSTSKKINPSFNPLTDILLRSGEVVINRNPVEFFDVTENGNYLLLEKFVADSLKKNMEFTFSDSVNAQLIVECNISNNGSNVQQIKLVKMTPIQMKKKMTFYGFSFKDLVSTVYSPSKVETSVNKTTKIVYQINASGYYALYDPISNKAIPIKIIKN